MSETGLYAYDLITPMRLWLDVVNQGFRENNRNLPERQFLSAGELTAVAEDCEQVYVVPGIVVPGVSERGAITTNCYNGTTGHFTMRIVRCLPGLEEGRKIPPAQVLDRFGELQLFDLGILTRATLWWSRLWKEEFESSQSELINVQTAGPLGNMYSIYATVSLTFGSLLSVEDRPV